MSPTDLRLFLVLCRTLNFHRASREAHVAPSTLTRIIQRLETEAGAPLFERDKKQVALTPSGKVFSEYARETLGGWESIRVRMQQQQGELGGVLRLFCTVTASYSILPDLLPGFMQQHPRVRLELVTGDAADALPRVLDGRADLAVAVLPDTLPPGLATRVLTRPPVVWIAPGDSRSAVGRLLKRRPIPWEEMPLIVPETGEVRENVLASVRRRGVAPLIAGTVSGHEAILALVGLGLGVGALPTLVLERSFFAGRVRRIPLRPSLPRLTVGLCVRSKRLEDPRIHAFWGQAASFEIGKEKQDERTGNRSTSLLKPDI